MQFGSLSVSEYGVFNSRIKFPRGMRTEPRAVEEYELELFTEDQPGISFINGAQLPLVKGTVICAKPGMSRYSQLPFKCLYLHIKTDDEILCGLLDQLPASWVMGDTTPLTTLFHRLLSFDPDSFPEERLLMQSCILELLHRLLQEAGTQRADMLYSHRKAMQFIERYIREHLSEELELKSLAEQVNLSASYFHKLFTRHFGTTPSEYVMCCRISAAKAMLTEGEMTMEQIADACGFSSQSYFNYRFKQQTGQTPLQYRRERLSSLEV